MAAPRFGDVVVITKLTCTVNDSNECSMCEHFVGELGVVVRTYKRDVDVCIAIGSPMTPGVLTMWAPGDRMEVVGNVR